MTVSGSRVAPFFRNTSKEQEMLAPFFEIQARLAGHRFEIGGRSKTGGQLKGDPHAWLAVDDTEVGAGHRIPLWLFGMLY